MMQNLVLTLAHEALKYANESLDKRDSKIDNQAAQIETLEKENAELRMKLFIIAELRKQK